MSPLTAAQLAIIADTNSNRCVTSGAGCEKGGCTLSRPFGKGGCPLFRTHRRKRGQSPFRKSAKRVQPPFPACPAPECDWEDEA